MWNLNKCTKCICNNGIVLCSVNNCPSVLCSNPIYDFENNNCCPKCPLDTNEPVSSRDGLVVKRKFYWSCIDANEHYREHGSRWKESDCIHCACVDGEVKCFNNEQNCPKKINYCRNEVTLKGECCPYCLDFVKSPFSLSSQHLNNTFLLLSK